MDFFEHLTCNRKHPINGSDESRLAILACAEHSLRTGKRPIRLFQWMISHWPKSLQNITNEDEDRGLQRLKIWRRTQEPEQNSQYILDLADKLQDWLELDQRSSHN